jgi:hypothetical protein
MKTLDTIRALFEFGFRATLASAVLHGAIVFGSSKPGTQFRGSPLSHEKQGGYASNHNDYKSYD